MTKIIKINAANYDINLIMPVARILAKGGLVAFPTETVYGLAVNAALPEAIKRLGNVKKSPPGRPFTFHLADIDNIHRYVTHIPSLAHRLIRNFWPGPLTLVLKATAPRGIAYSLLGLADSNDNWIGLRLPAHPIARDLIRSSGVSVIAPSANPAGMPAPNQADEVLHNFNDQIDVVIDSGPTRYKQASTVVKVYPDLPAPKKTKDKQAGNRLEILREGVINREAITELTHKIILFVCTGNICRSPMAVGLAKRMLAKKLGVKENALEQKSYKVISSGTASISNNPPTNHAFQVMKEFQCDISEHTSQPITVTMIEEADQVYVMTRGHLSTLKEWAPKETHKISLLDPSGKNIQDPIGGDIDVYRQCALKIKENLEAIQEKL